MPRSRFTFAVFLVCLTVLLAGCAGFGTGDSPAEADEPEPEETGDLENADDATDQDDSNGPDEATVGSDAGEDDGEADDADDASPESDDTDASGDEVFEIDDSGDDGEEAHEDDTTGTDDSDAVELEDVDEADSSADEETNDQQGSTDNSDEGDAESDYGGEQDANGADDLDVADGLDAEDEQDVDEGTSVDEEGSETDEQEAEDGDEQEPGNGEEQAAEEDDTDDGEGTNGDADADEEHTLTVAAEDVVTGESAGDAYYLLQQDGETIGEEQRGETATFEGLEDGEYALSVYDATADWAYDATITVDGDDVTYTAEVDRMHVYWATVEAIVVDDSGDPVEGETVTINGQTIPTDEDGVALYDREFHYADETEVTAEYGDRSETFVFDRENADAETVTFETDTESEGIDDEQAALTVAP